MSILLFIVILVVLILVHEFGHFIAAKRSGIRVEEFGLGYPPRLFGVKRGETTYSFNLLPFGGFVRIFGEDPDAESTVGPDSSRSFARKNRGIQALVLAAGIIFNIVFAWLLITFNFATGLPSSAGPDTPGVADPKLTIVGVLDDSPAEAAGIETGDAIISVRAGGESLDPLTPETVPAFIQSHDGPIVIGYERDGATAETEVLPREGLIPGVRAVGVQMDMVGILKLPIHKAAWEGMKTTGSVLKLIATGVYQLLHDAIIGRSDLGQVTGPVGMVGIVGDVSKLGFSYILTFTAFISLNLAVINLIPFPALDGGRILFVAIEAVRRKPMSHKFANTANMIGFVLLLALMVVVTFNDILRLV